MTHPHSLDEERRIREKALDETLAGTFPASDPPSSLPNPDDDSLEPVSTTNDVRLVPLGTPKPEARSAGQLGAAADAALVGGEAHITVHRESPDDVGISEIFVSIDGKRVAILGPHETFTAEVTPGPHHLRADNTLFWKTQDLVLRAGEHARFVAINKAGFGAFLFMIFLGASPLYLTFQRDK